VNNVNIRTDNVAVASFTGSHLNGKTDDDVELIVFQKGTMFYILSGVEQIFKNVQAFDVGSNLSLKRIKRSDLKNLEDLVYLRIFKNEITTLEYDTLRDLSQLENFALLENSLTEIDGRTFETNIKLKRVSLEGNKLEMLPRNLFANNLLLEYVTFSYNSLKIIEIDFTTFKNIKELHFSFNTCINAYYKGLHSTNDMNKFTNLTEFQNVITSKCSSV